MKNLLKSQKTLWMTGIILLLTLAVFTVTQSAAAPAVQSETETLLPYSQDGEQYGYVDLSGAFVIEPQFEQADDFSEGLAAVQVDDLMGYIDSSGATVIEPQFELAGPFREGLALIAVIGGDDQLSFGYVDTTGQLAIEPQFSLAGDFSEGLAAASRGEADAFLFGYIDPSGEFVIEPQWEVAESFQEGFAGVGSADSVGYIDTTGAVVIEPQFIYVGPFSDGVAAVGTVGGEGYIDTNGEFVIGPGFDYAGDFSEGLAVISLGEQDGYIDSSGEVVIPLQYDLAQPFADRLAAVEVDGLTGYINPAGQFVFEPQFLAAESFQGGLARALNAAGDQLLVLGQAGETLLELPNTETFPNMIDLAAIEVEATEAVDLLPAVPVESGTGICTANSSTVALSSAWQCLVEGTVLDACFTGADGTSVVCYAGPFGTDPIKVNLSSPLPEPTETENTARANRPWLVTLETGITCEAVAENTLALEGTPVSYICNDNSLLVGELEAGPVWTADRVTIGSTPTGLEVVGTETVELLAVEVPIAP
ncbi:MAG: WG repeat-containing protein [Anaerolineae bacterium]|nr:WG repeat-containing protein [Anaerolineae bacterium]